MDWIPLFSCSKFFYRFSLFLLKDSRLRVDNGKKSTELLVDCGLMFISLLSIVASVLLYLNWQEQLQYF